MTNEQLRTALANYAHEAWSGWMKYQLSECVDCVSHESLDDVLVIPAASVDRWTRQMNTPFDQLPSDEQKSDYDEADKILAIIENYIQADKPSRETLLQMITTPVKLGFNPAGVGPFGEKFLPDSTIQYTQPMIGDISWLTSTSTEEPKCEA